MVGLLRISHSLRNAFSNTGNLCQHEFFWFKRFSARVLIV